MYVCTAYLRNILGRPSEPSSVDMRSPAIEGDILQGNKTASDLKHPHGFPAVPPREKAVKVDETTCNPHYNLSYGCYYSISPGLVD